MLGNTRLRVVGSSVANKRFSATTSAPVSRLSKEINSSIGVRRILDDISFAVEPGEKIAVLGGNGAGKSTLLRIIGGVDSQTSGEIHRGLFLSWPLGFAGGSHSSSASGTLPVSVANQFGQTSTGDATIYNQFSVVNGNQFVAAPTPAAGQTYTPFPSNIIPPSLLELLDEVA